MRQGASSSGERVSGRDSREGIPPGGAATQATEAGAGADDLARAEERRLLARIRAGERHLFHELIRPYERGLYRAAYGVLGNEADAEEVVQEAVLKALMRLEQLRDDARFKGWLFQVAVNEARMRRRKDHKHLYESLDDHGAEDEDGHFKPREFADWREIPSDALERKELRQALERALASLSPKQREILLLRDVEHLSVTETAQALGITETATKTRLHRARLIMRERLAPVFRARWTDRLRLLRRKKL